MKKIVAILLCAVLLAMSVGCSNVEDFPIVEPDGSGSTDVTTTEAQTTLRETTDELTNTEIVTEAPPVEVGMRYQAHRGLSTEFPENTMPAFRGAIDAGFLFIELDPNFTKDGKCVLMHDTTINRTCRNADGTKIATEKLAISSLTYEELLTYDAGIFKGEKFRGTKVPLLSEVAELVKGTGVSLKLDNKIQNYTDEQLEVIFKLAEQYPSEIGFTCKNLDFVRRVKARLPDATIHYDGTVNEGICKQLRNMVEDGKLYIWYGIDKADADTCEMIKAYGYLGLWTIKSEEQLQKAISLDADIIETNGEVKPGK